MRSLGAGPAMPSPIACAARLEWQSCMGCRSVYPKCNRGGVRGFPDFGESRVLSRDAIRDRLEFKSFSRDATAERSAVASRLHLLGAPPASWSGEGRGGRQVLLPDDRAQEVILEHRGEVLDNGLARGELQHDDVFGLYGNVLARVAHRTVQVNIDRNLLSVGQVPDDRTGVGFGDPIPECPCRR